MFELKDYNIGLPEVLSVNHLLKKIDERIFIEYTEERRKIDVSFIDKG